MTMMRLAGSFLNERYVKIKAIGFEGGRISYQSSHFRRMLVVSP